MQPFSDPGALGWGLLALVCYPLLQLPVIVYLSRYVELDDGDRIPHHAEFHEPSRGSKQGSDFGTPRDAPISPARSSGDREIDRSTPSDRCPVVVVCPACNSPNDPTFTYCRQCVEELSGAHHAAGLPPR